MGKKDAMKYCLDEAESLAGGGHYGAALVYLIQAAEIATKEFLQLRKGIRVPYFLTCLPHLRETHLLDEDEEIELRRTSTMRNLAIHSGLAVSKDDYEIARKNILKLIEKLK